MKDLSVSKCQNKLGPVAESTALVKQEIAQQLSDGYS